MLMELKDVSYVYSQGTSFQKTALERLQHLHIYQTR